MKEVLRLALVAFALLATGGSPLAQQGTTPPQAGQQGNTAQKPAVARPAGDAQAPAEDALPEEAKAFNAAAGEKNPLKRAELLEQFIANFPKADSMLLSRARALVPTSVLQALKESRAKYQAIVDEDTAAARKSTTPIYMTYNRFASALVNAGVFSEEAEDLARKALAAVDEKAVGALQKEQYEARLKSYETQLANYQKAMAAAKAGKPAQPATRPAAPAAAADAGNPPSPPSGPRYRLAMKDGVVQASLAPPRPAAAPRPAPAPRQPVKPEAPTGEDVHRAYTSARVSALATLGEVLVRRGKPDEGERALQEAYAARPSAYAMATISRTLLELAKKRGDEKAQIDYLAALALSGRPTPEELTELREVYARSHNGSADGLEAMLDERYRKENVRFAVTPYTRKAGEKATGRAVLAEIFPGSG